MKLLRRAVSLAEVSREDPRVRVAAGAGSKREAIAAFYRAVEAPSWAAPNLDGLADVLGDLSWLPAGRITLAWVDRGTVPDEPRRQITRVLEDASAESVRTPHPLIVYLIG
jgi:hypothetical protein